jgi:hypothetical protein
MRPCMEFHSMLRSGDFELVSHYIINLLELLGEFAVNDVGPRGVKTL